ncbi:methylated-DNA/protein-cysteine methyltransferase [Thauera sp. 27]|uniref:methylated-DNA--[protein]-cysteine S-methyltransferase n=1 Tax=Thauera sp. 27 TaxID=305700 RepID=UPI0002D12195|nr:methylated-DNA--[protein]-cysteine S-methyltransferase [Thauera sp. 27]ENO81716.1 methylated-DNA/protein-cysteine methyltransferase [Thauera sp. 27]
MVKLTFEAGAQDLAADLDAVIALPFGPFGIRCDDGAVRELVFLPPGTALVTPRTAIAGAAAHALRAWIDDPELPFPVPLADQGTPFRRRVWAEISAIPRGQTRSYGELAARLGSAPRAVGQACGANPFPLVVPCHRVTSATGLGGFANARGGWLLDVKRWLLAFEGAR